MINTPAFNKPSIPTGTMKNPNLGGILKPKNPPKLGGGHIDKPGFGKPGIGSLTGGKPGFGKDGWNPAGTGEGLGKPLPQVPNAKLGLPPVDPASMHNVAQGSKKACGAGCSCCK